MMGNKKDQIWFPSKKYGVGWGLPITWQGWVVLLLYGCLSVAPVQIFMTYPKGLLIYIPYLIGLTVLFIFIVWKKGGPLEGFGPSNKTTQTKEKIMCDCKCQHPEKLRDKPENCTSEQIEECHGKTGEHGCACGSGEEKKTK